LPLRVNGDSSFGSCWARILLGLRKSVFPVGRRSSVSSPADRFFVNIASGTHGRRQTKSRLNQSTRKPPSRKWPTICHLSPLFPMPFGEDSFPFSGRLTFGRFYARSPAGNSGACSESQDWFGIWAAPFPEPERLNRAETDCDFNGMPFLKSRNRRCPARHVTFGAPPGRKSPGRFDPCKHSLLP
jgi:hypothetical protein